MSERLATVKWLHGRHCTLGQPYGKCSEYCHWGVVRFEPDLRQRIEALADEWDRGSDEKVQKWSAIPWMRGAAAELRAALAASEVQDGGAVRALVEAAREVQVARQQRLEEPLRPGETPPWHLLERAKKANAALDAALAPFKAATEGGEACLSCGHPCSSHRDCDPSWLGGNGCVECDDERDSGRDPEAGCEGWRLA